MNPARLFIVTVLLTLPGLQQLWAKELSGEEVYKKWCDGCHMDSPFAPGTIQLRQSRGEDKALITKRTDLSAAYTRQLVRKGLNGMPLFRRTEISNEELDSLLEFLVND